MPPVGSVTDIIPINQCRAKALFHNENAGGLQHYCEILVSSAYRIYPRSAYEY
jgi:hypothetical protein